MKFNRSTWILLGCTGTGLALFCIGCVFFGILLMIFSSSNSATIQAARSGRQQSIPDHNNGRQSPTEQIYRIGQDVTVAKVRWRVLEVVDLGNQLEPPNKFQEALTTPGRFIRIKFEVENLGSNQNTYGGVELIDRQGRRFENASNTFAWIDDSETCVLKMLNPNLPKTCIEIFEVPADAADLKLVVGDLNIFGSKEAQIDLGVQ